MQSKFQSFVEQICNIGSGFILAWLTWTFIVAPLIHSGHLSIDSSTAITIIFTVVSLIRSYIWRRIFNKIHS